MTDIVKTYEIEFFEKTLWDGFQFEVPETTMKLISELAEQVGAPNYVKTPIFTKSNNSLQQKRRKNEPIKSDITEDDWKAIRDFKSTKIVKAEGFDKNIDEVRSHLNKLTEKNYSNTKDAIIEIVSSCEKDGQISVEDTNKLVGYIFTTASKNSFCSHMYAQLVVDLLSYSPTIKELFNENKTNFVNQFDNIEACSPDEDYDKFCSINVINEQRRASSLFLINLMKLNVIIPQEVINIILSLQESLMDTIEKENCDAVVEEISENLYILIKNGVDHLNKLGDWDSILSCVKNVSSMKAKEKPSLKHKSIFKHMDILDIIKNK